MKSKLPTPAPYFRDQGSAEHFKKGTEANPFVAVVGVADAALSVVAKVISVFSKKP